MKGGLFMKKLLISILVIMIMGGFNVGLALDQPGKPLVAKVDVVMYQVEKPREFFDFLAGTLGLPVVWEYRSFGSYSSGGVGCGNVNIESLSLNTPPNTINGIAGISLEPFQKGDRLLKSLNERKIKYAQHHLTYITQTSLTEILPGSIVDFVEYNMVASNTGNAPVSGNPAGIVKAKEIIIGVVHLEEAVNRWRTLMDPIPEIAEGVWQPGKGPGIRLVQKQADGIYRLKLKVKSLVQTEKFLLKKGLFGGKEDHILRTDPEKTYGVIFDFEE